MFYSIKKYRLAFKRFLIYLTFDKTMPVYLNSKLYYICYVSKIMIKRVFTIFTITMLLLFSSPVYSLDTSSQALEKYTKKISNKFTRTYCNTTKFGISYEGALAFAIGETNKEFKNNKKNKLIDFSLLKNTIVNDLENNCQVYDFAISSLENLKFN